MKLFLFILIALVLVIPASAADVFNVGTIIDMQSKDIGNYANACGFLEDDGGVTYTFKNTLASDSTDTRHSRPFFIGGLNGVDAYCIGITSAASDINIIYHFSYDNRRTWTIVTPATFDALSSTAVGDTIGMEAGVDDAAGFHSGIWLVVEMASGSNATNLGEVITWTARFTRKGTYVQGKYTTQAGVANGSYTNP